MLIQQYGDYFNKQQINFNITQMLIYRDNWLI